MSHEALDNSTLELLVPEGGELQSLAREAFALVRAMGEAPVQRPQLSGAEVHRAIEQEGRARLGGALEDLLAHHLRAVDRGRSFLVLPTPRVSVQAAWESLLQLQPSSLQPPGVPGPGEAPLAVAARLLEGLYRLDWDLDLLELWRARIKRASHGQRAGERAFRKGLEQVPARGLGSRTYAQWWMGLVECLLDRGAVREARELAVKAPRSRSRAECHRLRRLLAWLELLAGDPLALESRSPQSDWNLELPRAMAQMREDWKVAQGALAGRDGALHPPMEEHMEGGPDVPSSRHDLGALAYCVFVLGPGGGVRAIHREVAPGVRSRLSAWVADRDGACSVRTTPEHAMLVSARPVRLHDAPFAAALSPSSLALALTPILDAEGEVAGWVHLEWEHHLIPDRERLDQLARSWAGEVRGVPRRSMPIRELASRVGEENPDGWIGGGAGDRLRHDLPAESRKLCAPLFEQCVAELGLKLAQRRWWAFARAGGDNYYVCGGGEGLSDGLQHPGGARAIDRCVTTSGLVSFEEPSPRLSIHAGSGSGLALPFLDQGCVVGLLVVESSRRRDFQGLDLNRLADRVDSYARRLVLAGFRSWHVERFGVDLHFEGPSPALRELLMKLGPATRAQAPVVFSGPGGTGKRMLARYLHWARGLGGQEIHLFNPELDFPPGTSREEFARAIVRPHGSVVLDNLPALSNELQAELLNQLELADRPGAWDSANQHAGLGPPKSPGAPGEVAASGWPNPQGGPASTVPSSQRAGADAPSTSTSLRARILAISPLPLADCMGAGRLRPDLGARLSRLEIPVPPLIDRREDLPGLIHFFSQRLAQSFGTRAPRFDDKTIALLWRQRWKGNLPELEALLYKLALLFPGELVTPDHVQETARQYKFPLLPKLPSKRPRRQDLLQALRTTLKGTGRINKRRAALYMGWDPDTLVLRMRDARLDDGAIERMIGRVPGGSIGGRVGAPGLAGDPGPADPRED